MVTAELFRELMAVVRKVAPPDGQRQLSEIAYALDERCSLTLARRRLHEREIEAQARQAAVELVREGVTTLAEINRVTLVA